MSKSWYILGTGMLSVVYITFRARPRFEWFVSSLERELRNAPDFDRAGLQVIVVDSKKDERDLPLASFSFEHVRPKPTVWQGPHRLTSRDFFCASNARNTAFALARKNHVAFVDDLSVLRPGWLNAHVHAARHEYVLCGMTDKRKQIEVSPKGEIVSFVNFAPGSDSRTDRIPNDELFRCSGGWLYGGTFSVPLKFALAVNGQDEICDSIGGEDYDFGMRLERVGAPIYITKTCGTIEDEDAHHEQVPMVRLDKPWPEGDGPYSSNHLYNRLLRESERHWTLGNRFNLSELRERVLGGESFPVPSEPSAHWVDGQPLREV